MKRTPFFSSWFFGDIDEMMTDIEEMMEKEFKEFRTRIPKDLVREHKLPDGSTTREWGPFVYGYSMTIGPDGKPRIRKFGNVKPARANQSLGFTRPGLDVREEREPLVDVITTNNDIRIVAELPGVAKKAIKLHGTKDTLTISVNSSNRKYFKQIELPLQVDPTQAKTVYKNGVLEIILPITKKPEKPRGEPIDIK
jgi:HSP20 family protein